MIKGVEFWDDRYRYYTQTNNAFEKALGRLESCGPTAATTIVDMMDNLQAPLTPGGWEPQPEDVLMLWFNDPRNADIMKSIRRGVEEFPGNQVPQYYPQAVREVYGVRAEFIFTSDFGRIADLLSQGNGVMLCLKDPGHYVAAVAYSDMKGEIIYHDPWPARLGTGFNLALGLAEYIDNVKEFAVVFPKEH